MDEKKLPYGAYSEGVFNGIRDVDELRLVRHVCCAVMIENHLCSDRVCDDCPCEKEFVEALLKCE